MIGNLVETLSDSSELLVVTRPVLPKPNFVLQFLRWSLCTIFGISAARVGYLGLWGRLRGDGVWVIRMESCYRCVSMAHVLRLVAIVDRTALRVRTDHYRVRRLERRICTLREPTHMKTKAIEVGWCQGYNFEFQMVVLEGFMYFVYWWRTYFTCCRDHIKSWAWARTTSGRPQPSIFKIEAKLVQTEKKELAPLLGHQRHRFV